MLYKNYIDGKWVEGSAGTKDVVSPIDGKVIGQLSMCDASDVDVAVAAAKRAQPKLESMSVFERAEMLYKIWDVMLAHKEKLATLLTKEQGKVYSEALGEIVGSASTFRECGDQIKWMDSKIIPYRETNKICLSMMRPVGVYGIITPWNFPIGTPVMYYLAPGLAAGCAMVWNPATITAAVASEFMKVIDEAGVPAGFLSLVIGKGSVVGDALSTHPDVAGIGFTGSTATGETICARAKTKHTTMELGGNGPVIVLKDADLELAADKICGGSFTNAGQVCTSTERVLVDDAVADELVSKLKERAKKIVVGDPFDTGVNMGPMCDPATVEIVLRHIMDGVAKGADVVLGGGLVENAPTKQYMRATILDHVSRDALLNTDETFGPVIPLVRFKSEEEIQDIVNDSKYGLFSAIITKDVDKALTMASKLHFGCVNINEGSNFWDTMLPAGGAGGSMSGHGRSGGKFSIKDFSEERLVVINLQTK